MKSVIFLACVAFALVAAEEAVKVKTSEPIPIVAQENAVEHDGTFHYSYESGDGTKAEQDGELKHIDAENAGESVKGSYSYLGDDGVTYSVTYIADENGFQPQGVHIPTPPPVPAAIARSLEYLATAPPSPATTEEKKL